MTELQILGENIRELRLKNKLSQEKLAAKCNLHRTYISAIECGTKNVCFKNLYLIMKVLNAAPSDIFRGL